MPNRNKYIFRKIPAELIVVAGLYYFAMGFAHDVWTPKQYKEHSEERERIIVKLDSTRNELERTLMEINNNLEETWK